MTSGVGSTEGGVMPGVIRLGDRAGSNGEVLG
ncbi:hypothetical protein LMG28140_03615 [Paraburkholderia metrosideri]|jgi:hypothetical protein|uniref:Uncharacterized protein n=1 Tax=Paraburkholderia metrosideri TaxID=580937 RepID=A0ABM8NSB4_9BURK|nr:hypothetical protein LMG28140_03615 [Paraburkholderia metrosideri]